MIPNTKALFEFARRTLDGKAYINAVYMPLYTIFQTLRSRFESYVKCKTKKCSIVNFCLRAPWQPALDLTSGETSMPTAF